MENTILILIKIITALFLNDKAGDNNTEIFDELKNILSEVKIDPRAGQGLGSEESIIESLRNTAEWMLYNRNGSYNKADVIQRLNVNFQANNDYIVIAKESIDDTILGDDARNRVNGIMQELKYSKKKNKLKKLVSQYNAKLNFGGDYIEVPTCVNELMTELSEIHSGDGTSTVNGLISKVDFTDPEQIKKALESGLSKVSYEGCLNTGLIGLNKAMGGFGIARGELVNFGGLTHHYKSGILLDLSNNIPTFNDPWMINPAKKPLILRISFENTTDLDTKILYQNAIERETKKECKLENIILSDASEYLTQKLQSRGYTFHLEHYDPDTFNIYDLFNILNNYMYQGYEIHAVILDYLSCIAPNTFGDRLDIKIQKTYEMARNFCNPKGIACITAHQLSTEAQTESRNNSAGFTRRVCTGGWYMDCKSLHTKLDLEMLMHIHQHVDGKAYLMFSRGKHRNHSTTPQSHRHFMYPFSDIGGIGTDYGFDSRAMYSLPSVVSAGNDNIDWD